MGLLNSALHTGRNAILGYQSALQVIGSNISSAGSADYTRLTPHMSPLQGTLLAEGLQPGAGVSLTDIRRNVDEALDGRLRIALGDVESASVEQQSLAQIETLFDDLNGAGISSQLTGFFSDLDDLQNTPEDAALRDLVVADAVSLTDSIRSVGTQVAQVREGADSQIEGLVLQADQIAKDVTSLNRQIAMTESRSNSLATGLRDEREALLRDLGQHLDITVRSQPDGSTNVYVGSETLIQGNIYRGLTTSETSDGSFTRTAVVFADTGADVEITGGRLGGLINVRDTYGQEQIDMLDQLAGALAFEMNKVHSNGQGQVGFTEVIGTEDVLAVGAALDSESAGLVNVPQDGSFFLTVADDATSTPVSYRIDVQLVGADDDTTLESLVSSINIQSSGVAASITNDNRLKLTADDGYTFTFGHDGSAAREDTSNVLAALGVNTFFVGNDSSNITVNEQVRSDPSLIATSAVLHSGDGSIARAMAELGDTASSMLGDVGIVDYYNQIAGTVAVSAAAAGERATAADSVLASLMAQRENVSGVNLDEEAIELLKFERSFQSASRYIRVVDDLIQELVTLIR